MRDGIVDRLAVVEAARECIGTPYHHQGRALGVGMDCFGPIVHAANRVGVLVRDVQGYSRQGTVGAIQKYLREAGCPECPYLDSRAGVIGVFWLDPRSRADQHVCVFTGTGMLHCYSKVGRVVEHEFAGAWPRMLIACFEFPGGLR